MFQFRQAPPPPVRNPSNRYSKAFYNVYDDAFYWGFIKSTIGFAVGVFVARQISQEFANGGL